MPALKNQNLRDPGPQAFGFLTNSPAAMPLTFSGGIAIRISSDGGSPARLVARWPRKP